MATAALTTERDYFTDHSVLLDPYDYFEQIRRNGPVYQMKSREDVIIVTGFREAIEVLLNTRDFSSWLNPDPLVKLPFAIESDDIGAQMEAVPAHPMELRSEEQTSETQ